MKHKRVANCDKLVIVLEASLDVHSKELVQMLMLAGVSPTTMDTRNSSCVFLTFDGIKRKNRRDILKKIKGLKTNHPTKETRLTRLKDTIADTAKLLSASQGKQYLLQLENQLYPRNLFTDKVKEMIFWV